MKKLMITIGFAAMISLFTGFAANADGFNKNDGHRQPMNTHQNERVVTHNGGGNQGGFENNRGDRGRFEKQDDRGRFDRGRGGDRFDRNVYRDRGDRFRDRHYHERENRDWR
jgi:hypothetical protein